MNHIFTGISQKNWQLWGESWLCSAINLGNIDPNNIFIISNDLNLNSQKLILDSGSHILATTSDPENFLNCLIIMMNHVNNYQNNVAFWQNSAYFKNEINEVFQHDLTISQNLKFISFNQKGSEILQYILTLIRKFSEEKDYPLFFQKYFKNLFHLIPKKYSCDDIENSKDACVVQIPDSKQYSLAGQNFLFWEKYQDLYSNFTNKKIHNPKICMRPIL